MFTAARSSRVLQLAVTLSIVAGVALGSAAWVGAVGPSLSTEADHGAHALSADSKGVSGPWETVAASSPSIGQMQPDAVGYHFGVVATVGLGDGTDPVGVAYDTANGAVYVTSPRTDNVSVINGTTQKLVTSIALGENPTGVVYDSVNTEVYVGTFFGDVVKVINTTTNSIVANITVPGEPLGLACACNASLDDVYVEQQELNSVTVISGTNNTVIRTVSVGEHPMSAAFDAADGYVYVANFGTDNLTIINATDYSVSGSVPVGSEPEGITYDSANSQIYVSNYQSDNVSVINGTSVVASVKVGGDPVGIAYNAAFSLIAVVSNADDAVNFFATSNNTVVGNVSVGHLPVGIAYDPVNRYEYVANSNTSNVSVIGTALRPPYSVTFTESGLPGGTDWSVTLAGVVNSSKTNVVGFWVINGTGYTFSVTPIAGYTISPSSGTLSVDGFPVNQLVTFKPVYYGVTFHETGLANGTLWTVTFDGFPANSTNSTLLFSIANGTYSYTVTNVSGYSVTPSSGTVTVAGASRIVSLTFSSSSTPSSSTSSSGFPLWEIIVIVAVVAAVIIGLVLVFRRRPPPSPALAAAPGGSPPPSSPGTNPRGPP